jgi:hypothetical protein
MADLGVSADGASELPPPSLPTNLRYHFHGFANEATDEWRDLISSTLSTISSWLNLERLDGVTVAVDYADALASLERGFQASRPLRPSTEIARGVAMAAPVLRDGVLKAHLMLDATHLNELIRGARDREFLYLLAHECAHVADMRTRDLAFPNFFLRQGAPDLETEIRWQTSLSCWEEYAACRLTSQFHQDQIQYYERGFSDALDLVRERADQRIRSYDLHGNDARLVTEVAHEYRNLMTFASYVIGHLAGANMELSQSLKTKLDGHWFRPFYLQLESALQTLWDRDGGWTQWAEFDSIGDIGRLVMLDGGVDFRRIGDELYLDLDERVRAFGAS